MDLWRVTDGWGRKRYYEDEKSFLRAAKKAIGEWDDLNSSYGSSASFKLNKPDYHQVVNDTWAQVTPFTDEQSKAIIRKRADNRARREHLRRQRLTRRSY